MHKSIFTFVLLASSLVMLSAIPLLNNNNTVAMAQGYNGYNSYYSQYPTDDKKYECRTGPFEGFFVSSVEFCKHVKFDDKDRKDNRTGTQGSPGPPGPPGRPDPPARRFAASALNTNLGPGDRKSNDASADDSAVAVQQMADILGLPLGTLKSRLFRARVALRDELKTYMG